MVEFSSMIANRSRINTGSINCKSKRISRKKNSIGILVRSTSQVRKRRIAVRYSDKPLYIKEKPLYIKEGY
jgi:chemotaxis receptor (MCP) glutamine deamidase CheD